MSLPRIGTRSRPPIGGSCASAPASSRPPRCGRSVTRRVQAVAGHLARLWDAQASAAADGVATITEKGLSHARASVLNLIVIVVDDAAADRVVNTLVTLGVRHPSRAIVLVPDPGSDGPAIDAKISTHCHEATDGGERVCCEEVVLAVHGEAAGHLSGIVVAAPHPRPADTRLVARDPPFRDPVFDQVVDLGDRRPRRLVRLRRPRGGDAADRRVTPPERRRRPQLGAPVVVAGADRPVLRRPALPPLPAQPEPPSHPLCRPGASRRAAAPPPLAQALLYAGWIATRLGWRRHRTLEPLAEAHSG